jgi:hypothetical protein
MRVVKWLHFSIDVAEALVVFCHEIVTHSIVLNALSPKDRALSRIQLEHFFGERPNSRVFMSEELFECAAPLAGNDSLPCHASFEIPHGLAIGKFFRAEFCAVSAEMLGVAATGELLIGSSASTCPAIMAGRPVFPLLRWHRSP